MLSDRRFFGNVDAVTGRRIIRWAWDRRRPDSPVEIEIRRGEAVVCRLLASIWRRDLQMAGKGSGVHGFVVDLAGRLGPGRHGDIDVVIAGTEVSLGTGLQLDVESTASGLERPAHTARRFCGVPFEKFVIETEGNVHLCCPSYLPTVVGNAHRQSFEEVWNSEAAQEVRASIADGSFRYCLDSCPAIQTGELPTRSEAMRGRHRDALTAANFDLAYGPVHLSLLHDRTCNLACPSCREHLIFADAKEQARLRGLLDRVIEPMLASVETIELAGGEFLASRHLREGVARIDPAKHPHLRVAAFTNGTLFNEREWATMANVHGRFEIVEVSLDAARPATFEKLRRGGRWEIVRRNLDFIAALRKRGEIGHVAILFVVQLDNYLEMVEFVHLGKELGCDSVRFHELVDFHTYSRPEFQRLNILDPAHPDHPAMLRVLPDEAFNDPIVRLGNLTSTRHRALGTLAGAPA